MGEINMWQRSKVNRWRQKGPEDYVCPDCLPPTRKRNIASGVTQYSIAIK